MAKLGRVGDVTHSPNLRGEEGWLRNLRQKFIKFVTFMQRSIVKIPIVKQASLDIEGENLILSKSALNGLFF